MAWMECTGLTGEGWGQDLVEVVDETVEGGDKRGMIMRLYSGGGGSQVEDGFEVGNHVFREQGAAGWGDSQETFFARVGEAVEGIDDVEVAGEEGRQAVVEAD